VREGNYYYSVNLKGTPHHQYYVYMVYFLCSAELPGEYVQDFTISVVDNYGIENTYNCSIGADFYMENESLTINLGNKGTVIPKFVQNAIHECNVHEENIDNILINRKFKELISNHWDIMDNRGSYKSLINSLKWFEWGDLVKLEEVWKYKNRKKDTFELEELKSIIKENYRYKLNEFIKTTYFALTYALQKITGEYDDEYNPVLVDVVDKWSKVDISLKMCLLGNFYKRFFMPIHSDLILSTMEDIVFSKPINIFTNCRSGRNDHIHNIYEVNCKTNSDFKIGPVECYVNKDTLFGDVLGDNTVILGVSKYPAGNLPTPKDISRFVSKLYKNHGCIIEFDIDIPLEEDELIKKSILTINFNKLQLDDSEDIWGSTTEEDVKYVSVEDRLLPGKIKFNILCNRASDYIVNMQFYTTGGKSFTKTVNFTINQQSNATFDVYRVLCKDVCTLEDLLGESKINDFSKYGSAGVVPNIEFEEEELKKYIVAKKHLMQDEYWTGVKLSNLLNIKLDSPKSTKIFNSISKYLAEDYFMFKRNVVLDGVTTNKHNTYIYVICISKQFCFEPQTRDYFKDIKPYLYRNDYIFIPEFHRLEPFGKDGYSLSDYKITAEDTLCVIPSIPYNRIATGYHWVVSNELDPNTYYVYTQKEPFIANPLNNQLVNGIYSIDFNYSFIDIADRELVNDVDGYDSVNNHYKTITKNNVFIKV
jgi:hypothetical protein